MRIFVAGGSGVIGRHLVPLLVAENHVVAAMTRSEGRVDELHAMGAVPVLCDVYDRDALVQAVLDFAPDLIIDQLTDLPDHLGDVRAQSARNNRIRRTGTANLVEAAQACSARIMAQSIGWALPEDGAAAVEFLEQTVLSTGGTILRYGQFYGPGTYFEAEPPPPPRVQIDEAARRTLDALFAPSGIVTVIDMHTT
ncbi:NAD-dependent epimerase/dehydratase family protein [Ferrimicrobium sp.]|uniref:NAD-dependent epimerase/dehydratase family protein n=1 Tax=Ferrimicrobium sp. TaxID=2926050 RepID=UPI00260A8B7E|nr:NAD-dependent epimerase/dehydratase family protein [Ferrimicrobium sp.]